MSSQSEQSPLLYDPPQLNHLQFNDPLVSEADVVVVGGGIIGVCTAYYLAQLGQKVMLCEKGVVAGEQSSRNWGWVRQHARDEAELPIMMESARLWDDLAAEIGEDVGYRQHGVLYLASSNKKLAQREAWIEIAKQYQLNSTLLSAAEVAAITGTPEGQWCGGVYTASDGRAEPWIAVPAIARAASRLGVVIKEHCAVRNIEQKNQTISGVVTEHGLVKCNRVVLACGAWSSLFAGNMGIYLPQLCVRSTVVKTTAVNNFFSGNAADESLAFRRRQDESYSLALTDRINHLIGPNTFRFFKPFLPAMKVDWDQYRLAPKMPMGFPDAWRTARKWSDDEISPFEKLRVLDPEPNHRDAQRILDLARRKLPSLKNVSVEHSWAGMIDSMPDIVPVIDNIGSSHNSAPAGLTFATGFSGHGFGIGPAAGKLVADLVCNHPVPYDLDRFRLSRFTDGSAIELGPIF